MRSNATHKVDPLSGKISVWAQGDARRHKPLSTGKMHLKFTRSYIKEKYQKRACPTNLSLDNTQCF